MATVTSAAPTRYGAGIDRPNWYPPSAGPIVRAHDFLPQLARRSDPATIRVGQSVFLILGGLFKKVVIASHVSTLFDRDVVECAVFGQMEHNRSN